jgi:hypothetical protein
LLMAYLPYFPINSRFTESIAQTGPLAGKLLRWEVTTAAVHR